MKALSTFVVLALLVLPGCTAGDAFERQCDSHTELNAQLSCLDGAFFVLESEIVTSRGDRERDERDLREELEYCEGLRGRFADEEWAEENREEYGRLMRRCIALWDRLEDDEDDEDDWDEEDDEDDWEDEDDEDDWEDEDCERLEAAMGELRGACEAGDEEACLEFKKLYALYLEECLDEDDWDEDEREGAKGDRDQDGDEREDEREDDGSVREDARDRGELGELRAIRDRTRGEVERSEDSEARRERLREGLAEGRRWVDRLVGAVRDEGGRDGSSGTDAEERPRE